MFYNFILIMFRLVLLNSDFISVISQLGFLGFKKRMKVRTIKNMFTSLERFSLLLSITSLLSFQNKSITYTYFFTQLQIKKGCLFLSFSIWLADTRIWSSHLFYIHTTLPYVPPSISESWLKEARIENREQLQPKLMRKTQRRATSAVIKLY